jgi:hypothetical protein
MFQSSFYAARPLQVKKYICLILSSINSALLFIGYYKKFKIIRHVRYRVREVAQVLYNFLLNSRQECKIHATQFRVHSV